MMVFHRHIYIQISKYFSVQFEVMLDKLLLLDVGCFSLLPSVAPIHANKTLILHHNQAELEQ